jgi:HD superfamily phosphohydrolase
LSEKIYRDSVHNIIRLKTDSDEGKLLVRLIDTAEFQRLRRIKQLGLALFAYQSAEHSRFTHSLGALHLATRTLDKLKTKYSISAEAQTAVRVAALLHDIGHGAFSHVIETILHFHHEQFTIEAVLSDETEVGQVLRKFSPQIAEDVAAIIRGDFRPMDYGFTERHKRRFESYDFDALDCRLYAEHQQRGFGLETISR